MKKNAVLFVNTLKKNAADFAEQIKLELDKQEVDTAIFKFNDNPGVPPRGKWDIAFSLGGDGTVLYTARCLAPLGVPILPVNMGTLGFIAEVSKEDWLDVFLKWEKGEITHSFRCMFNVSVERKSEIIMENFCLNDAVITCTGIAKLIKLDVSLEPQGVSLGAYRCDGLIISTPTGSTAYSMAAGGPILDPEMDAVIINPICPFALSNRPYVLSSKQTIAVTVADEQRSEVLLTVDGQEVFALECGDRILVKESPYNAKIIFPGKHAYYSTLRHKLFWSSSDKPLMTPLMTGGENHA